MSADELNINYTREAFMNPINLGGLLIATLTAFFISDFGDASSVMLRHCTKITSFQKKDRT